MKVVKKLSVLLIVLLLLVSSVPLALAQDAAPTDNTRSSLPLVTNRGQGGLVVSKTVSEAEQQAALKFWTREQLSAAQPLPMPAQTGAATVDESALSEPALVGPGGVTAAGAAAPGADAVAQQAFAQDWAALDTAAAELAAAPDGTSQVYTSYTVNQYTPLWKIYPHVWVGRLSFRTPSGTSYCSATSISGNNIVTAAHCVYDSTNNVWYSNWVFSPAFRAGNSPYGLFPAARCWILNSWINLAGGYAINTWARWDVAVCEMNNNSAGQTLNGAVGWAGRQWNWGYVRHFHNMGYPFRDYNLNVIPNAGAFLRLCAAESFTQATDVRGMGCNWGPGISGGPWMVGYAPFVVAGAVDGVNSGLFVGTQNLYGIRFTSNNIVPLCNAAGC